MSHAAWNAVTPGLSSTRRVIAFDIAGFGLTPALPKSTRPTVPNLVDGLARSIEEMGIAIPVDIAGNSLGGYMALEAARRGIARTVVAISPAGLWKEHPPAHVQYVFNGLHFMATHFPRAVKATMQVPLLRELALVVPVSTGTSRMPLSDARRIMDDLSRSAAFQETFENTRAPFSGTDITVPVTVAFGDRDWILPKSSRCRNGMPAHTRWIDISGWGHVPMWLDPEGVARLILNGTATRADVSGGWNRHSPARIPA